MKFSVGVSYPGIEQVQGRGPSPDSVTLRAIGRRELSGLVNGEGALWGADDHTSEGGYRGDTKPDDNTEGHTVLAPSPNPALPPEGIITDNPSFGDIARFMGHDGLRHTVDLAA